MFKRESKQQIEFHCKLIIEITLKPVIITYYLNVSGSFQTARIIVKADGIPTGSNYLLFSGTT